MNQTISPISVKKDTCVGCGICVSVCPFTVLIMEDGVPRLNPKKRCLNCLHCAAACPRDAILFGGDSASAALPSLRPSEKGLTGLPGSFSSELAARLTGRRSYRHFSGRPVEDRLLKDALNLADFAPSAKNQHPTAWIVVNGREKTAVIMNHIIAFIKETGVSAEVLSEYEAGNNVVMGTAPTLILGRTLPDALNPLVDTALALSCAELYLQANGVGTCWAGYLSRFSNAIPALRELLGLPEGAQVCAALMAGYPEGETYVRVPRRALAADITWL